MSLGGPWAVLICLQKRKMQEKWKQRGGTRLQPGTGLSWQVNKPMSIAAIPLSAPSSSNAPGAPPHEVKH